MRPSILGLAVHLGWSLPFFAVSAPIVAQDLPPAYIQIFREEVKPGRTGPHVAAEAGWPRAFAKAKIPNHYIAMTTIYGPSEAWFVEGHKSVAEIEEANAAIEAAPGLGAELDRLSQADAANISSWRAVLARNRPELSNAPGGVDVSQMRVWEVLIFQARPGHEGDFGEAAKLYKGTVERAKIDAPWATFEVLSGMPGPAFLVFVPHRTLGEIDPATGAGAAMEKAFTEETMKKLGALAEGYSSVESMVFAVSPEMSYMQPEIAARDPKFWSRKPATARSQPPASKPQQ